MINRVMFWMLVVGTVVVIVSPAYMMFDLSEVNEPPILIKIAIALGVTGMSVGFLYLWIMAWRRLFKMWHQRPEKRNLLLFALMVFASPLGALYFYFNEGDGD